MPPNSDLTPKPLFVVGRQRSGTTWVANTLLNHSRIFGIITRNYFGIKESSYFSHFDGRFGSLTQRQNYLDFLDLFSKTVHFQLSGVDKDNLAMLHPQNYAEFFRVFMETAAKIDSSGGPYRYWLEKSPIHTLYLQEMLAYYPDAYFVGIERDLLDTVRSTKSWIQQRDKKDKLSRSFLPRAVLHWGRCRSFLRHYCKKNPDRFVLLSYEAVKKDPEKQFKTLFSYLKLDWKEELLENKYGINTSFVNLRREDALSNGEEIVTRLLGAGAKLLPHAVYALEEKTKRPRYDRGFRSLFLELEPFITENSDGQKENTS